VKDTLLPIAYTTKYVLPGAWPTPAPECGHGRRRRDGAGASERVAWSPGGLVGKRKMGRGGAERGVDRRAGGLEGGGGLKGRQRKGGRGGQKGRGGEKGGRAKGGPSGAEGGPRKRKGGREEQKGGPKERKGARGGGKRGPGRAKV
jgi:hypothetical protein